MPFVFVAQDPQFFGYLPIDRQIRVAQQQSAICLGVIEVIAFIGKDRLIAQHRETMCKTTGNEELPFVLLAQLHAVPLSESGAVLSQIDRHIQHPAYRAAH